MNKLLGLYSVESKIRANLAKLQMGYDLGHSKNVIFASFAIPIIS